LIKTLVSNSTFDRGSLSPTYVKPFDVFAEGSETGDWLAALDDFRMVDPRSSVNGLLLEDSPRFREVSLEE
jgi:hypothetical protein